MNESFLNRNYRILKTKGFKELFYKFFYMSFPTRIKHYKKISKHFRGRDGIEIGGPSPIFSSKGRMPLYHLIKSLDGCNFSRNTLWEGDIETDDYHYAADKSGYQFIADAVELDINITDKTYDCLISSNCLGFSSEIQLSKTFNFISPTGCIKKGIEYRDEPHNSFDGFTTR